MPYLIRSPVCMDIDYIGSRVEPSGINRNEMPKFEIENWVFVLTSGRQNVNIVYDVRNLLEWRCFRG